MKLEINVLVALLIGLMVLPVSGLYSNSHAGEKSNPVRERQKLMRSVGKAMKTTVKMIRGEISYEVDSIVAGMKTMGDVADRYTSLFPEGSDMENSIMDFDHESSAKPEIWANMADFKAKAAALKTASAAAMKVAGDKAALSAALANLGNACKACHQKYKAVEPE